MVEHLNFTR